MLYSRFLPYIKLQFEVLHVLSIRWIPADLCPFLTELPITAGVLTAVILTVLLIVGVYCVRRRRLERRNSIQKTDSQQPPGRAELKQTHTGASYT